MTKDFSESSDNEDNDHSSFRESNSMTSFSGNDDSSQSEDENSSQSEDEDIPFGWNPYTRQHKLDVDLPSFTEISRINYSSTEKTPISYFQLFLSDDVFEYICQMTEKYYQENKKKKAFTHKKKWETPDVMTMKCYFGLILYGCGEEAFFERILVQR